MKKTIKQLEYQQRAATRTAGRVERQLAEQITRLSSQVDANAKTIAGQLEAIGRLNETIKQRDVRITELQQERDRIVRLVDQFTSVSIGTFRAEAGANLPKDLRRT